MNVFYLMGCAVVMALLLVQVYTRAVNLLSRLFERRLANWAASKVARPRHSTFHSSEILSPALMKSAQGERRP